jgi:hypothetical protein
VQKRNVERKECEEKEKKRGERRSKYQSYGN